MEDFLDLYLDYAKTTPEVPTNYSRWAAIIGLGAYLGRQFYFEHGNFHVYPNIYGMFIGVSGARKGTAIKLIKKVMQAAGYNNFAYERTSKEKFLLDLAGTSEDVSVDDILDNNIFGADKDNTSDYKEVFIAIDEFNDFIGIGNIEFISMLGNMWNYSGVYTNRIKTGKSVEIPNPTISILGGNTPTNFALAFPTAIVGQGFLSRMLIIHGEPNGRKVTFPPSPTTEQTERISSILRNIKDTCFGPAILTSGAESTLDKIYRGSFAVNDVRFESYSQRRLDHLIKLCLIVSAASCSREITTDVVIRANTYLVHAEQFMPKALGEFGKARNSDISHKVLSIINNAHKVVKLKDIWEQVSGDLDDIKILGTILNNLELAGKIQTVANLHGFLPVKQVLKLEDMEGLVDWSILSQEEREMTT